MSDVTQILQQIEAGGRSAAEDLLPLVYDELRKLAAARMANESPDHTLQPTALVHDAYVRLVDVQVAQKWNSRGHFFAAAAEAMRRILVESARRKQQVKHGGGKVREQIDLAQLTATLPDDQLLKLDDVLQQLRQDAPDRARLVELRFFAGMTIEEAAGLLEISSATAKRQWRFTKAWLHQQLQAVPEG